eukprot:1159653-Pelagomonas_calceolata.AAC.1
MSVFVSVSRNANSTLTILQATLSTETEDPPSKPPCLVVPDDTCQAAGTDAWPHCATGSASTHQQCCLVKGTAEKLSSKEDTSGELELGVYIFVDVSKVSL